MNIVVEWQPEIVSTQLATIGSFVIAVVPGEFTTMAGRRLREAIVDEIGQSDTTVVIAGLSNTYSSYITTPEEYEVNI